MFSFLPRRGRPLTVRPRTRRRAVPCLAALVLAALVLLAPPIVGAGPAHAEPEAPGAAGPGSGDPEPPSADAESSQPAPTEHFAGLLREEPEGAAVVVDDSLAGDYDLAVLERDLHEAFGRLGTPYYVVASPFPRSATWGDDFLAGVQDRVGQPGLYVYLRPSGSSVHAVAREVNLPADQAVTLLTRERLITTYTPLDRRANALVDVLRDPDLDERYSSGSGYTGWYVLGPVAWWTERHVQALLLNTADGPARLGETAAAVLGLTGTLGLALGAVRSGRRRRAAAEGYPGRTAGERALMAGGILFPAAGAVVVIGSLVHLTTATLPQDEQQVGPLPPATPPYVAGTERVERVAEALRQEPLYVDPLADQSVGELAEAAERAASAELPVYTAVVPMTRFDESGGDPEILAHALHHVLGEDGVYVVVDGVTNSAVRVETALFGAAFDGEEQEWERDRALREVTGHQYDLTTAQVLDNLLDVTEEASAAPGEASPEPAGTTARAEPRPDPSRLSQFVSGGFFVALFMVGPLIALMVLTLAWGALRVLNRMRAAPGRALRPRADRAVRRATRALRTAADASPGRDRALREIDAALAVLAGHPDELDLVGVTVLADRATRGLDTDPDHRSGSSAGSASGADVPVCMVNPLHGPSVLHEPDREQPLCASCAALSGAERARRTLRVAAPGGGRVTHLSLDRSWITTGYGTLGRLDVEDLLKESDVH